MNKNFVPYAEALELKKLGFDEPCLACYTPAPAWMKNKTPIIKGHFVNEFKQYFNSKLKTENVAAPLYQQAFEFFREKYGDYLLYSFGIIPHFTIIQNLIFEDSKISYDEAELECLRKLIKIVKTKNNEEKSNNA